MERDQRLQAGMEGARRLYGGMEEINNLKLRLRELGVSRLAQPQVLRRDARIQ